MVEVDAPRWNLLLQGGRRELCEFETEEALNSAACTSSLRAAVVSPSPGSWLGCLTFIHSLVRDDSWNKQGEKAWEAWDAMQKWLVHQGMLEKEV